MHVSSYTREDPPFVTSKCSNNTVRHCTHDGTVLRLAGVAGTVVVILTNIINMKLGLFVNFSRLSH